jgi:hypothetical protein
MSNYDHDVFISLSHAGDWIAWLDSNFLGRFNHHLHNELGSKPKCYVARHSMHAGDSWPIELGRNLARSKTLLAICTKPYRNSDWCRKEFSMMRAREDAIGLRNSKPGGLIVPVIAHDCEDSPDFLSGIETLCIKGLTYLYLCRESKEAQSLDARIEKIAIAVAKATTFAPPFEAEWESISCAAFVQKFQERRAAPESPKLF